jgi:Protein of unknown function (DUF2917)
VELNVASPVLALDTGQVLTLDDAIGTRISARCGIVWVTEENDRKDYIVEPGEYFVVDKIGRTVVQALAPAWVALQ